MACGLNKSVLKSSNCDYGLNQITELYLANFSEVASVATSGSEVTAITLTESAKWYKIEPQKDTASYSDNLVVSGSGIKYRTHQIGFTIGGAYNALMKQTVNGLSLGKFVAVATLATGQSVLLGNNVGLEAASDGVNVISEAAADGQQGAVISLSANVNDEILPVTATVLASIKENVSE